MPTNIDFIGIASNWSPDYDADEEVQVTIAGCGCCSYTEYYHRDDKEGRKLILERINDLEMEAFELREFLKSTAK